MIARFRVLLPYVITLPFDSNLTPVSFKYDDYQVTFYPPMQANIKASATDVVSQIPFADAGANLEEALLATPTEAIKVNGKETIQANMLLIDFLSNREFTRTLGKKETDPPLESFLLIANKFIEKFRLFGSFANVIKLTQQSILAWRIEYLSDEGLQLEKDIELSRSVHSIKIRWQANVLTTNTWNKVTSSFSDFKPYVWDSLLLDAYAQANDINAAIVLANAALEAAIDFSLKILAQTSQVPYQSYEWLANKRDFTKQPSAKEKFDEMLYLIAGRSLKTENKELWKAFLELRDTRNSMVHEGSAVIRKGKNKIPVDIETTSELLKKAGQIVDWLETLLPEKYHREKSKEGYRLGLKAPARERNDSQKDIYLVGIKSERPIEISFAEES